MKQFFILLRTAFKLYVNRDKYIYFYGAKGETLTDGIMNAFIEAYPSYYKRFTKEELAKFKNQARGKIGLDCSGFITAISGIYGNSAMIYEACPKKTTVANGKAGSFLFKRGDGVNHCGLDIGYGYCMHIGSMGKTIEIAKIQAVGFTMSGELPEYDYSGATNY